MHGSLKFALFAAISVLICPKAMAQIRIGADLGPIHIRIAPEAPPPPRPERRTQRPTRGHAWINGYWDRHDNQWAWIPGHWERPARRGSRWVRPLYRNEGGAYRYEPGHWSHQRLEEGEDYSRWKNEHRQGPNKNRHNRHRNNKNTTH